VQRAVPSDTGIEYLPVPLEGLAGRMPVPFPLYLETADGLWVLYRDASTRLDEEHLGRLVARGVRSLHIRTDDRQSYYRRVEDRLDAILKDRAVPLERRADVLHGVAVAMAQDLLARKPDRDGVRRAQRVLLATSGLLVRDRKGFQAVRSVLRPGTELASHSLSVGFLSMGLARHVLGADPNVLLVAGLAGLLHDVGRAGTDGRQHDPDHPRRGYEALRALGLPEPVCQAALHHHERWDGTGYPDGLEQEAIPDMARLVGLVDTFDKIHAGQQPRVGVFDALRILAQAYRGCFDERLAQGLVLLFR
jgi:putative nucleotidyltransferase with HDIG domain